MAPNLHIFWNFKNPSPYNRTKHYINLTCLVALCRTELRRIRNIFKLSRKKKVFRLITDGSHWLRGRKRALAYHIFAHFYSRTWNYYVKLFLPYHRFWDIMVTFANILIISTSLCGSLMGLFSMLYLFS